jgi:hypothetical protein
MLALPGLAARDLIVLHFNAAVRVVLSMSCQTREGQVRFLRVAVESRRAS